MKYLKWTIVGFFATILLVVTLLLLILNSNYGRERVVKVGLSYAHDYLNARVAVGELSGNLFTHIHLANVSLQLDTVTVVIINSIDIHYSPWMLLNKLVRVDSVHIRGIDVEAYTMPDSSWCFQHLHRPLVNTVDDTDTSSTQFKVDIRHVTVSDLKIKSLTPYEYIPKELAVKNGVTSFYWDANVWSVGLEHIDLSAKSPDLNIVDLRFVLSSKNDSLELNDFNLKTEQNQLYSHGLYSNLISYSASLVADTVDVTELSFALPQIKFKQKPSLSFRVHTADRVTSCHALLTIEQQMIDATLSFSQLTDSLFLPRNISTKVVLKGVKPHDWGVPIDPQSTFTATVLAKANKFKSIRDTVDYQIDIDSASYTHYRLFKSFVNGRVNDLNVSSSATIRSNVGEVSFQALLSDLGKNNRFKANGSFANLKPERFTYPAASFDALLNGGFDGAGTYTSAQGLALKSLIFLKNSIAQKVPIDSASMSVTLRADTVKLSNLDLYSLGLRVDGDGSTTFAGSWEGRVRSEGQVEHLVQLFSPATNLKGFLVIEADFKGVLDSTAGELKGDFSRFSYDSIQVEHAQFGGAISYSSKGGLEGNNLTLKATHLLVGQFLADSIRFNGDFDRSNLSADIEVVQSAKLKAALVGKVHFDDDYQLTIKSLTLQTPYANLYNANPLIDLTYSKELLTLKGFHFKDRYNPEFNFMANGSLSLSGNESFEAAIEGLDINLLKKANLADLDTMKGMLSSSLKIAGTSQKPLIDLHLSIDSLNYRSLLIKQITSDLKMSRNSAQMDLLLLTIFNDSLSLSAKAPQQLKVDSMGVEYHFPGTISGRVRSTDMDLGVREAANRGLTKIGGLLSFDLLFNGHYAHLIYKGRALLKNGFYNDIKSGIYLNQVNSSISVDSNLVTLDSLNIGDVANGLSASGWMSFDTTVVSGKVTDLNFALNTKSFSVVKSKEREVVVGADLKLQMDNKVPMLTGDIDVIKSSFYYPTFLETDYKAASSKPSLLVVARDKHTQAQFDTLFLKSKEVKDDDSFFNTFYKSMGALVHVDIPKNSWLKSETSKIELKGEINVIKKGYDFTLQGKIEVTRGQLAVYGKKFVITAGTMEFQGGDKINPLLDITTEYEFRDSDGAKKVLKMRITDFMEQPTINYTLDGQAITASNAYSYIIFGKPMSEIGSGEQTGVAGSVTADMVSKIVSNQLSQTIGETFSLDIIEINTSENLQSMAFVVGKYITKDIFITYQKGFGETSSNEYVPDQFTLEYEFRKNLFFRLQSGNSDKNGVDLILKFER